MFKCLEMRTSCITFERLSSLSVWCVPVCLEKLCFHFGLFISLPLMRCHSRAFTLHFYLILGVMKVRKMCLELSLWPVFFFLLFLECCGFDQVLATVSAWSRRPAGVWGPHRGHIRLLLVCRLKHRLNSHRVLFAVCGQAWSEQKLKCFLIFKLRPFSNLQKCVALHSETLIYCTF